VPCPCANKGPKTTLSIPVLRVWTDPPFSIGPLNHTPAAHQPGLPLTFFYFSSPLPLPTLLRFRLSFASHRTNDAPSWLLFPPSSNGSPSYVPPSFRPGGLLAHFWVSGFRRKFSFSFFLNDSLFTAETSPPTKTSWHHLSSESLLSRQM